MFAPSHRMTFRDFVLLGSSVALLVVFLWPTPSDRQSLVVRTDNNQYQRYSVAVDDPRLRAIKLRLKKWETPRSSRALRTARWHQELADYYAKSLCNTDRPEVETGNSVTQVSFIDSKNQALESNARSFWTTLRRTASVRIEKEERRIQDARETAAAPIVLGPVVRSVGSTAAYPIALFAAFTTMLFASRRQRANPPIELACQIEHPASIAETNTICLRIPPNWVQIHQPTEVVIWRTMYGVTVLCAATCVIVAIFR